VHQAKVKIEQQGHKILQKQHKKLENTDRKKHHLTFLFVFFDL